MMEPRDPSEYELVLRPTSLISFTDLVEIWRYRELIWTLASRDVRVRYKQALFGIGWALLQPLVQMVIFTLLFNRLAGFRSGAPVSYPLYTFAGLVIWTLFASSVAMASNSMIESANVIRKVYFPRIVIPLASVMVGAVDFLVGFVLVLIAIPIFGQGFEPSILLTPLFAVLALLCAFGLGLWTSAINVQFRDVRYALPFFLQLLIFVTPVFYPASMIPEKYQFLLLLNPMAAIVDGFRAALFGTAIDWDRIRIALALIVALAASGFLYFRRMEQTFADRV